MDGWSCLVDCSYDPRTKPEDFSEFSRFSRTGTGYRGYSMICSARAEMWTDPISATVVTPGLCSVVQHRSIPKVFEHICLTCYKFRALSNPWGVASLWSRYSPHFTGSWMWLMEYMCEAERERERGNEGGRDEVICIVLCFNYKATFAWWHNYPN